MNSGYSGVDPKFPPGGEDYSQSSYLGSTYSEHYNQMHAAAGYHGYGAAAMSGYPNPRDPMGYSNYYQQCSAMTPQQAAMHQTMAAAYPSSLVPNAVSHGGYSPGQLASHGGRSPVSSPTP